MRIGINGYEAVVPRFGFNKEGLPNRVGSGEFCFRLLIGLNNLDKKNNYFIYLPSSPTKDMPMESANWKYIVFSSKRLWTLLGLTRKLNGNPQNLDIFFSPTHYSPITGLKSVISILDVSYLHFKNLFKKADLYKLKYWGGYSIKNAKRIITISQSSKNDIIEAYSLASDKVSVVYPGVKEIANSKYKIVNMEEIKKRFGIEKDFILFVGTLQPRKNVGRLIEALSKLKGDFQLVIVGKKGWQYEDILDSPKKFGVENKVRFLHDISEEELPSFYQNAKVLVLPSLYEGFGLPVLEAMQYGCPVITSNISSLPEAGGDAALYVDPENVADITEKIEKVLADEDLRKKMIEKGKEQVKKFSWEKAASQTLKIIEEVVHPVK